MRREAAEGVLQIATFKAEIKHPLVINPGIVASHRAGECVFCAGTDRTRGSDKC